MWNSLLKTVSKLCVIRATGFKLQVMSGWHGFEELIVKLSLLVKISYKQPKFCVEISASPLPSSVPSSITRPSRE